MAAGNTIEIVGNMTRDPELKFTPSGQAVTNFGVAVNRRWQNRQTQEWEEQVSFFDVVAWGQMAENVAQSLQKGARVIVTGRLDQRTWETQEGDNRSKIEIVADEIAPSLRWATCQVTKISREDNGGGQAVAREANRQGGQARKASGRPVAAAASYDEEEPFLHVLAADDDTDLWGVPASWKPQPRIW